MLKWHTHMYTYSEQLFTFNFHSQYSAIRLGRNLVRNNWDHASRITDEWWWVMTTKNINKTKERVYGTFLHYNSTRTVHLIEFIVWTCYLTQSRSSFWGTSERHYRKFAWFFKSTLKILQLFLRGTYIDGKLIL